MADLTAEFDLAEGLDVAENVEQAVEIAAPTAQTVETPEQNMRG